MVVGEISGELTSTEPVNGNYCLGANGTMFFKHIFSKVTAMCEIVTSAVFSTHAVCSFVL